MGHVVLLGDSILDNRAYVGAGPAVIDQLQQLLPSDWQASLLAVDGSLTGDVLRQLDRLPPDASHIVVSAGGNDALMQMGLLQESVSSVGQALGRLAQVAAQFSQTYGRMVQALLRRGLPAGLCTIYDPAFPDPQLQQVTVAGVTVFNDVITRAAVAAGLPLLDLRLVCNAAQDYANPIEPSSQGGAKIAQAIVRLVVEHDFGQRRTVVFS